MIIENLSVRYGNRVVFEDFDADFVDSRITMILGPSGCGKTTLLNAIAEREAFSRRVSYIFQEPRLLPWLTLRQNLEIPLEAAGFANPEREERICEYLSLVGLGERADSKPAMLSGGERQRVSIARAFAVDAPVLLMDEPFQSQDGATKQNLINLVKRLQEREQRTILGVTHYLREAEALANQLMLLGGTPATIRFAGPNTPQSVQKLAELIGHEW